jgi:hypothetical protein
VLAGEASAGDNLRRRCHAHCSHLHTSASQQQVRGVRETCVYTVKACSAPVLALWLSCSTPAQWSSAILSVA